MKGRILGSMEEANRALERYLRACSRAARPLFRGDLRDTKRNVHQIFVAPTELVRK
tara:strand:+ start:3560 stop:3727 length:168 start_codon:yes stop_codon:yes gene_type:complete